MYQAIIILVSPSMRVKSDTTAFQAVIEVDTDVRKLDFKSEQDMLDWADGAAPETE